MANIITLKGEAEKEGYSYFNENIRPLVMKENGEVDYSKNVLWDNNVDAFRHAYVSGVYTLEYDEDISKKLGVLQERFPGGGSSSTNSENSRNMDYWNNDIGRKYGKTAKSRKELAELLQKALENGELIISLDDPRKFEKKISFQVDSSKPVVVLKESETGRNELFFNLLSGDIFDRVSFVSSIESGAYPGYLVANIDGLATPMSKPDGITSNNLG